MKTIQSSNKNVILDVGMEKERKQELGCSVSVLPIPAFHCILCTCNKYSASSVIRISISDPSIIRTPKIVTAHAQSINYKMAAIIFVGVFTTLLWLIHCGAKEKERCIICRVKAVLLYNGDT